MSHVFQIPGGTFGVVVDAAIAVFLVCLALIWCLILADAAPVSTSASPGRERLERDKVSVLT
jgi:hypothetical protein